MKSLQAFRDRFGVPISDKDLKQVPFYRPPEDSPEMRYMRERRAELGGRFLRVAGLPIHSLRRREAPLLGS